MLSASHYKQHYYEDADEHLEVPDTTLQLGGTNIPETENTFFGTSMAEYGGLLLLAYPAPGGPILRYNDFRQVLANNPCLRGEAAQ